MNREEDSQGIRGTAQGDGGTVKTPGEHAREREIAGKRTMSPDELHRDPAARGEAGQSTTIRRLEARVARLERSLADRSRLLRHLTRELCEEDLVTLSRVSCGLPPLPRAGFGLRGWRETTALSSGDVDRTMEEVWRSVTPPGDDPDEPEERDGTLRA